MLIALLKIIATPGAFMFPVTGATWVGYLIVTLSLSSTIIEGYAPIFLPCFKVL